MQDFKINEVVGSSSPAVGREKIVNSILANQSNFSGDNPPTNPVACMFWADTENKILWQRNLDNTQWINKGAIDGELAELDNLKKYSANTNLFINSLFEDWNGATLPYSFWNYYGGSSRNAKIEKISVYDDEPYVNQLATLLNDDYHHRATQSAHALKVTLEAGNGEWSLNQEALVPRDSWISQGIYLYIVTEGDADIRIHDDPWPQEINSIPQTDFNQPIKWFQFKQTGKAGGDLGFMISIKDSSAPVTVYMMAPWLCYGYCDHWVDSGLNTRTLKKLNRATPFVCANVNPFFSVENGDQFLHAYNPDNHTITQSFVEPEYNDITQRLSYYLGGFDDDGNPHGLTLLSYAKPRFMKVTVTRNPEHDHISFTLTGTGDQYSFISGTTTAFIGLFGVEKGNVTWRDGTRVDENKIMTNVRSYVYRGPNAQGYGSAYHYDYFGITVDDGVDELEFYLCAYINCAGYARYWNEVAIPATITQSVLTGDSGYRVDRVNGLIEQWGKVVVNAIDEDAFYVNFPRSFDHECTNVLIMPYEDTENSLNNMVPVLIGDPEDGRFKMRFQWNGNGTPQQSGFMYRAWGR